MKGANLERNALHHNLITLPTMRCRAQNPEVVELVVCHLLRQVDVPSRQRIPSTGARDHITWMITPWAPSTGARDHITWLITPWAPQPLPLVLVSAMTVLVALVLCLAADTSWERCLAAESITGRHCSQPVL